MESKLSISQAQIQVEMGLNQANLKSKNNRFTKRFGLRPTKKTFFRESVTSQIPIKLRIPEIELIFKTKKVGK